MKKISVLVLFAALFVFGFSQTAKAQGNLQFSQVLFFDIVYGTTQSFNVPAGKVWKIESAGASSGNCTVWLQNGAAQYVGNLYYVSSSNYQPSFPIWLPTSYSGFFAYNTGSCTGSRAFVSVIEFNIVP
jgi:hypothetical protein